MSITGQPPGQLAGVIRAADRIDYLIRRHVHAIDFPSADLWSAPEATQRQRVNGAAQRKLFAAHDRSKLATAPELSQRPDKLQKRLFRIRRLQAGCMRALLGGAIVQE